MISKPNARRNVLRIADLWSGYQLICEIFSVVDSRARSDDNPRAAARCPGNDRTLLSFRFNVSVDGPPRGNKRRINLIGKKRFDGGWPCVNCDPLNWDSQSLF